MEFNTPEERIAAAIWPPENPDFRDICNTIRPYTELEIERAWLAAYMYFRSKEAQYRGDSLLLRDLIQEKQNSVDQKQARVKMLEEAKKKLRPIRP